MRLIIIALLGLLAGAIFVGHYGWVSAGDVSMPAWGWLMMGFGIFFTLLVGGGLMALVFYSNRAGFDATPELELPDPRSGRPDSQRPTSARRERGLGLPLARDDLLAQRRDLSPELLDLVHQRRGLVMHHRRFGLLVLLLHGVDDDADEQVEYPEGGDDDEGDEEQAAHKDVSPAPD